MLLRATGLALAGAIAVTGAARADDMFDVAFGASVTSDYISRGITQTDHGAALQGYIEPSVGIFYAGIWASNVSFTGTTDTEVDAYFGVRPELGNVTFDLGYNHTYYLETPGGDSGEFFAKADIAASDNVTLGGQFYVNPISSAIYTEANADITLPHDFGISGALGFVDDGSTPYTTWNAGLYYAPTDWAKLDLRYSATNLSDSDCASYTGGAGTECDGRIMLSLSVDSALSALMPKK